MWIAGVVLVAGLALLALLLVPRGRIRADGRLPLDIETRILLGERPEDIDDTSLFKASPPEHQSDH